MILAVSRDEVHLERYSEGSIEFLMGKGIAFIPTLPMQRREWYPS